MAKKLTKNRQEFNKQVKRIKRFIKSAEKRGYVFPDYTIPSPGKTVRKRDIEKLKRITPKSLYETAIYTKYADPKTGEALTGSQGRSIERSLAAKKAAQTRKRSAPVSPEEYQPYLPKESSIVLNRFESILDKYNGDRVYYYNTIYNLYLTKLDALGQDAMAKFLEEHPEIIEALETALYYRSKEVAKAAFNVVIEILQGSALSLADAIKYGEESEIQEDWNDVY